jgi:alpha/beta superfamily hydrolase
MMSIIEYASKPGHHQFLVSTPDAGYIEVGLSVPEHANYNYFAVVGHPHPLQEGTMNNKVVTTVAKTIWSLNIPVLRFNFRGVGQSSGEFSHGLGEADDMLFLIQLWKTLYPNAKILLSGFSFGSYVASRVAQRGTCESLILVAPPVGRFPFDFEWHRVPDVLLMGDADEVVSPDAVLQFSQQFNPMIPMEWFEHTGHFFHGKLVLLKEVIAKWVNKCLKHD